MKTIDVRHATRRLGDCAQDVAEEPMIVTQNGKPLAALVSLADVDQETIALSLNPQFIALIERSRARARAEGEISSAEMRRRLGIKPLKAKGTRKHLKRAD